MYFPNNRKGSLYFFEKSLGEDFPAWNRELVYFTHEKSKHLWLYSGSDK